ncbi:MAG TPA: recombinase family protein [Polyangiaceae bacterium]|nr:recombinase family protein [Polyangiaceae bacterium]
MAPTSDQSVPEMFTGRDQPVLRCAVYTRQSVAHSEQDLTSCDVQRETCENYVLAMQYEGWQLLDERFDDLGVSGAEFSRPALDRLKSWCVQGRVDVVVATRLDRLNRKMTHWVQLAEWFKQAGVEIVFVQGGAGARGPLADLVNNVVASFAEFERELIRERLRDGHARMRERGLRSAGRVPLGYKADLATRQLLIDETEADLVRAFFERCAAGESGASIARWANEAGHRTKVHGGQGGKRWSGRTVLQIIRNPLYVGERTYNGGTVEGVHDGVVDSDLAERAWRAIDERRTRTTAPRGPALEWDRDPYMLRGLLRCVGCGRVMTTSASAKVTIDNPDEVPRYYRCRGDASRPACAPPVQVPAQRIEPMVLDVLRKANSHLFPDARSRGLLEHLRPSWSTWSRADRNLMVRNLVWSIRWHPRRGLVGFVLDDIAIDNFIEQGGERFAHLPPRGER